jgi:hypothetical protein
VDPVTENPESQQQQNEEMANGFLKNSENAPREGNNIRNVSKNAQREMNSSLGASRTSETAATTLLRSLAHPGRAYAEKATSVSIGTTGIPGRPAARSKRSSGNMDRKNGNADSTATCSARASENRDSPAASRSLRSTRSSETAANSSVSVVNYTLSHANSLRVFGKKISHANSSLNVQEHSDSTSVVTEKAPCRADEIAKKTEQRKASSSRLNGSSESDGDVIVCGSKQNVRKLRGIRQVVSDNNRSIHLKVNILHKGKPSSINGDKRQGQQKFLTASRSPKAITPRPSFTEAKQNRVGTNEDVTIVYSRIFLRMEEDTEEHMPDVVCIDDEEKEGDEVTVRRPRIVEQDLHVSLTEVSPSLNRPSLNPPSSHSESSPLTAFSPLRCVSDLKNQKAAGQKVLTGKAMNRQRVTDYSRTSSERNVGMSDDNSTDIWSRLGNPEQLLCDAATLLNK